MSGNRNFTVYNTQCDGCPHPPSFPSIPWKFCGNI